MGIGHSVEMNVVRVIWIITVHYYNINTVKHILCFQAVNEDSLKRLSEYVASLQVSGRAQPTQLVFYIRKQTDPPESFSGKL